MMDEQRLKTIAQEGNIDSFYTIIKEKPHLLELIDKIPFADTPLHLAASAGQTHFALELLRLKPSLAKKPNPDGFSPMHLALQSERAKLVLRFVAVDPDLVRVKGRGGITPLHYVAATGNLSLLAKFLSVCPKSIEDLTIQGETALHIAVKNNMLEALEVLVGWVRRIRHKEAPFLEKNILDWEDEEGNTLLHIATSTNQIQAVRLLLDNGVEVNAKNSEGLTALDLLIRSRLLDSGEMKRTLSRGGAKRASCLLSVMTLPDYLRSKLSYSESWVISIVRGKIRMSSENRNALLVVAVLIATAAYQVEFSFEHPSSNQESHDIYVSHNNYTAIPQINASRHGSTQPPEGVINDLSYIPFSSLNSVALLMSISVIIALVPRDPCGSVLVLTLMILLLCHVWLATWLWQYSTLETFFFFAFLIFLAIVKVLKWSCKGLKRRVSLWLQIAPLH